MNSLVQELARPDIKNVVAVLEQAKSNIIPVGCGLLACLFECIFLSHLRERFADFRPGWISTRR